jgi:Ca2+-binding RTX toxin-like protein
MPSPRSLPVRTVVTRSLVIALLWLFAGGAATGWGAAVQVSGSQLLIDAPEPVNHVIDVRVLGMSFVIADTTSDVTAGAGCGSLDPKRAICGALPVETVSVTSGPGNDLIGLWDLTLPTSVDAGEGNDLIETGTGPDTLIGGDGIDTLVGGDSVDRLVGDDGDDLLEGDAGADALIAGQGNDILESGESSGDVLNGDAGEDLLRAGTGGARLDGGGGDDVLVSGTGSGDVLDPGTGKDTILRVNAEEDTVLCRPGDEARTRGGERVDGCSRVPRSKVAPKTWPPASTTARATTLPPFNPKTIARPRLVGGADRYTVLVAARRSGKVKVCIRFYDSREQRVTKFTKQVRKKHGKTYYTPDIPRESYYGRPFRGAC